eukprot:TRINITY_DN6778_c0_g4_i1.p1 TRINITY_DN6778_c0_g4~~TRINITY_DN6778_c0_g4_i1.p1  ORF type:complete len:257 (+),score=41.97 TRINITY_DN6778_c0_g4_i1:80-772(+)
MADSWWTKGIMCCCNGGSTQTDNQLVYNLSDPQMDEGRFSPLLLPVSSEGQMPSMLSSASTSAPSTVRSLSSEERKQEKERLQDMVKEFVRAVNQCHWLPTNESDGSTGNTVYPAPTLLPAVYLFDRGLSSFSVMPQDGKALSIALGSILEIVKDARETPLSGVAALPPPHRLSGDEIDKRFACLRYKDTDTGRLLHMALLLPDEHERDRFVTCMKILRWAVESKMKSAS